jgi:hypothetical protein
MIMQSNEDARRAGKNKNPDSGDNACRLRSRRPEPLHGELLAASLHACTAVGDARCCDNGLHCVFVLKERFRDRHAADGEDGVGIEWMGDCNGIWGCRGLYASKMLSE